MLHTIEPVWLDAFETVLRRCALQPGDTVAVLCETQSRLVLPELAEGAVNLTFKRYIERPVTPPLQNDHITYIEGTGVDAELRAFAGNFLFSTGANEVAGRFTRGHFDLPMRYCTVELDGVAVVQDGVLQEGGAA